MSTSTASTVPVVADLPAGYRVVAGPFRSERAAVTRARKFAGSLVVAVPESTFFEASWLVATMGA